MSASCRNGDPDRLFVTGARQREARTICRGCPVLTQCLSHALNERIEFGVWGGMTERERRAMLRRRPDVTDWEVFLRSVAARRADVAALVSGPVVVAPVPEPARSPESGAPRPAATAA